MTAVALGFAFIAQVDIDFEGFGKSVSSLMTGIVVAFVVVTIIIAVGFWYVFAKIIGVARGAQGNATTIRVTQTTLATPINDEPVATDGQADHKQRSLRCESCGAVNVLEPGQSAICAYCSSPL
jgi:uncharacterized paraquat-inducible protein A